jgi:NAD(P)H-hydrate repair Nnr-like enzyme with NAD(P)H-hydrate dehydratase domain
MIAGLLAQGMRPKQAAVLGVCLHSLASEEYVEAKGGRYSLMARDIIDILPAVLPK